MKIADKRMNTTRIGVQKGVAVNIGVDRFRVNGTREVTGVITVRKAKKYGPLKENRMPPGWRGDRERPQYV